MDIRVTETMVHISGYWSNRDDEKHCWTSSGYWNNKNDVTHIYKYDYWRNREVGTQIWKLKYQRGWDTYLDIGIIQRMIHIFTRSWKNIWTLKYQKG